MGKDTTTNIRAEHYNATSFVVFVISMVLVMARLVMYFVSLAGVLVDIPIASDILFSVLVQIATLFCFVMLFYKTKLKMSIGEVVSFSNIRRTKPINYLLAFVLGICVFVATMGVSLIWTLLLSAFGYRSSAGGDYMPDTFDVGIFVTTFVLTAILPAICEEVAIRGGLLTVLRGRMSDKSLIVLMGLVFGLFHGYAPQLGYTALSGALLCYLVLVSSSLILPMIVHFVNNGLSVILSNVVNYSSNSGYMASIATLLTNNIFVVIGLYFLFVALGVLIVYAIARVNKPVGGKGALVSIDNSSNILSSATTREPLPTKAKIYFASAIVVASLETVATFIWGLY